MYNGRKKGIIIAIIIVVLVIILGVAGFFVYSKTDLLKSNQTLFFKYMGQTLENFKYVENTQMAEIRKLKEQKPYIVAGTLSFESDDENNNVLENMKLTLESKVDKTNEKSYAKANLEFNSQNLFTLEYANSNNIYALKSDEIATAYLGIENNNLKVLAQKLEVMDTTAIPDTITQVKLNQILKISEEEKLHLKETYLPVLIDSISKENYTKETDLAIEKQGVTYNTTAYRLGLNAEELKQLQIALLTALKEDSITLNLITTKAKLLGLDETYTQINNLNNEIEKQINRISKENTNIEAGLDIIVYVENGKVITTDIIVKNEIKLSFYGETKESNTNKYIAIENLTADAEYNKIEIQLNETRSAAQSTLNIIANIDDEIKINAYITNTGSASENSLSTTYEITFMQDETTSTINYNQETAFKDEIGDIIEIDRTNCGVLNDYTTEQLQVLMQSLMQRITEVLTEKIQVVGLQMNQVNTETNNDMITIKPIDNTNNQVQSNQTISNVEVVNEI